MNRFRSVLQILTDFGVEFVEFIVVGGVAAALQGAVRNTLDVDVVAAAKNSAAGCDTPPPRAVD